MAEGSAHFDDSSAKRHMVAAAISEVLLICAAVLAFFVYLDVPLTIATAGALGAFFLLSLFSWQSLNGALAVIFISLLASELAILKYADFMLAPFVAADAIAIVVLLLARQHGAATEKQA